MATRSIRKRLLISLTLLATAVVGISLPLSHWLIDREFERFVIDKAEGEAHRLELLLQERTGRLRANAIDYGDWGSTVAFIEGGNPDYLGENVYPAVLQNFDVDAIFITDRAARVRYFAAVPTGGQNTGLDAQGLRPLPPSALGPVLADPRVRRLLEHAHGTGLILRLDGRWHLLGASSISHPGGSPDRPVHGVLGYVAELTPQRMQRIATLAGVPFSLDRVDGHPVDIRIVEGDVVMHRLLRDEQGQPMAALDIRYPQPLAAQIAATRRLLLLMALGFFGAGAALIWWLVMRGVISRLERLHDDLLAVTRGDIGVLPTSGRNDEVDHVAAGINHLHAELKRINGEWRHEALHDPLTGLGNRAQLLQRIEAALSDTASMRRTGLLLIDLDGFKTVNDLFGHIVGDDVLRHVAARMALALPPGAHGFRLGGDEFAILTDNLHLPAIRALAHMVNATIRADDSIGPAHMLLSASIGVALHDPADGTIAPGELLRRADIALFSIKRRSRNGFAVFDASMLRTLERDNATLRRLREALQAGSIDVWYQPIVAADDGRTLSFEALARWHDDELGDVPPSRFVTIAEEHYLGAALDRIVLEKAIAGLQQLRTLAPDATLSVNASVQSLLDAAYVARVPQALANAGLDGQALRLEITESTLAANEDLLFHQLETLRAHGVRIELDDFGTGHSSLGRLAKLQPRGIKLDRSFIRDRHIGGDRVCRAIIGLAQQLGVEMIAEGIESEDDARFVRDAGCDALQGYLFSRPLPLPAMLDWLRTRGAAQA